MSILHILNRDFFPRVESQSQVVQSAGHNQISKIFDPVSAFVFNNSEPFDATYNSILLHVGQNEKELIRNT